jgi:hypothetical protein
MSGASTKSAGQSSREVRSLANLSETASTSRVLNLARINLLSGTLEEYSRNPFFKDAQLNRAIIIKHTLRVNERDLFTKPKRTATKLILPFDVSDLRLGARSIFINQVGFDGFCRNFFNYSLSSTAQDIETLKLLDTIPSLDPFLVREHLNRQKIRPAACYFKIAQNDVQAMIGFANSEIEKLVRNAFGDAMSSGTVKLTDKILSNELDKELSPLKLTLRMSDEEFSDGLFSWRGFLYFKWRYLKLQDEMRAVLGGIANYQPVGSSDDGIRDYLRTARPRIARKIVNAVSDVGQTLSIYDQAYHALIDAGNPGPFRRFLLDGPNLFYDLGESIGILGHVSSFWGYRIGLGKQQKTSRLSPMEYVDMLMDFEESMSRTDEN